MIENNKRMKKNRKIELLKGKMKPRLLSREEEAELARSNKKVKDIHHVDFNNGSREGSPSPVSHNTESSFGGSFKDKLIGDIPGAFVKAFEFENLMDECGIGL